MGLAKQPTVLITGSTDGLGRRVAHDLANRGATLLVHGRDLQRCKQLLGELNNTAGNGNFRYYVADLSSLDQVRKLAQEVEADNNKLDVLINNAGIGGGNQTDGHRELSTDGYELRFAVNYLATFMLTELLLPLLRSSGAARIVNVSSAAQQAIDFSDVMLEHGYSGMRAYSQSKLAQVMFTLELAEKLDKDPVSVNCLHPASLMDTKMVYEMFGSAATSTQQGADATEYLAVSEEIEGVSGHYFDGKHKARAHDQAYDRQARARLWEVSRQLVGL
jgi:NAD(P)-dependent dehydrogenase (short-subunit alcohol dehydrogenase family)